MNTDNNGHLAQALTELLELQEQAEEFLDAFGVHTSFLLTTLRSIREEGSIDNKEWTRLSPVVNELTGLLDRYAAWATGGEG